MYLYYISCRDPPKSRFFFFNDTATTEIYTLSLHDALPISSHVVSVHLPMQQANGPGATNMFQVINRSEEHTSELQSQSNLVCRLLLEKKKKTSIRLPYSNEERTLHRAW